MAATFLQFASPFIHPESYLAANYNRPPPEVIRKYKEREDRAHSGRHRWSLSQNVCNSPERIPTWLTHREPEHQHEPAYYQSSYDAYLARSPPRSAKLRSNGAKTAYHRPGDQKDLVVDAAKLFESTAQLLKKYESPEIPLEISTDTMDRTMEVKPRSAPDLFIGWDKDEMAESQSQKQPSASKNLQAQPQPPAMPRAVSVSANAARKQEQNIRFDEPAGDQPPLHDAIMRCVKKCVVKASDDGSISLYNTPASSRPSSSRPWSRRSSRFTVEISQQELNSARAERIANLARPKSRTGINERSGPSQTLGTTTSLVASSTVTASSAPSKSATLEQPAKVSRNSSHKQPQVLTTEQARAVMNFTSNLQKNTTQTLTLADWSREQVSEN
ncbi:hypothetical protein DFS34DRAFT_310580 [Phlyctochytrium arcticum]|nr:hypothetical protein DFS34DRAFT_310580 [Phlyctochytrium arcticum]